ncbi:MAG: sugar ABC transporter ATP-binding protein [Sulfobacillus sp.]
MTDVRLELHNIAKTFVGQVALDGIDFSLRAGEIHGLAGHNGSGKSTLIKIIAGYHHPDPGSEGLLEGVPFEFGMSSASYALGLRFVHQELDLIDDLSIFDNFYLSRNYECPWFIGIRKERARIDQLLQSLGISQDVRDSAGSLKGSQKVSIAIAKAVDGFLDGKVRVLVLDEADAFLPTEEKEELFRLIRSVAKRGVAVLYVSHNLSDLLELADIVTVLRGGSKIWSGDSQELNYQKLASLVIGSSRSVGGAMSDRPTLETSETPENVVAAHEISGWLLDNVSFTVNKGEIVGFTGLSGAGWEEIATLLAGAERVLSGSLMIHGQLFSRWSPRKSSRVGVALIPGDRRKRGIIGKMSVRENVTLPSVARGSGLRTIGRRQERRTALTWMDATGVVPPLPESLVETFSGGNQQKVLLARALRVGPSLLVLDDPFQGVDVGAVIAVSEQLKASAAKGMAVVVSSSDPDDLVTLCDRIFVVRDGSIVSELAGAERSVARIVIESGARDGSYVK